METKAEVRFVHTSLQTQAALSPESSVIDEITCPESVPAGHPGIGSYKQSRVMKTLCFKVYTLSSKRSGFPLVWPQDQSDITHAAGSSGSSVIYRICTNSTANYWICRDESD